MTLFCKKHVALALALVAGMSVTVNAQSSSEATYDSEKSWVFSKNLGSAAYDLSVRSIQLVCDAPGAALNAYVTVKSPLTAFTKVVVSSTPCSESGVLVNVDAQSPNRYSVESRHVYSDEMLLAEWSQALTSVFGTLAYSPEASSEVDRYYVRGLLREEVNGIEFACPGGASVVHYVAKSRGARIEGDTAVPCPTGAVPGQVLALLTRGSESSSLSHDIRDGLFVSNLRDEYRALLTKDVSTDDAVKLVGAVSERVQARNTF